MEVSDMPARVFVSHSSLDASFADEIVRHLESSGLSCWISSRDISPGSDWAETIYNAISSSSVMLLLYTGNANDSWQIRNELDIATNLKIPIIPVKLETAEVSKGLKYFTNSHQWLDGTGNRKRNRLDRITNAVNRVLGSTAEVNLREDMDGGRPLLPWLTAVLAVIAATVILLLTCSGNSSNTHEHLMNLVAGGSDSWDYATDIIATDECGFIASGTWDWGFWSEAWVAAFDSSGSLLWNWSDSLSGECKPALLPTDDGGVITAFGEYADFQHTGYWVRAVRLDSLGSVDWDQRWRIEWPGTVQPVFGDANLSDSGRVQLAFTLRTMDTRPYHAVHVVSFDDAGQEMRLDTFPNRVEVYSFPSDGIGGHYQVYKDQESSSSGVEHLTPDGVTDGNIIVGDRLSTASCAAVSEDGGIIVLITAERYGAGSGDLVLMKFSQDMALCWEQRYGGEMWDGASDVMLLPDGRILVAGSTKSYGDGSSDGWVLLLDEEGSLIWQKVIDCGGNDGFRAVSVHPDGTILLAGSTTRYGDPDAWLLSMTPEGEFNDTTTLGLDLLTEDWECGFLDQAVWVMGYNRNYTPNFTVDTLTGNTSLDANNVPVVTRSAFIPRPGLSLEASVYVADRPEASGSNWLAMGLTTGDSRDFRNDPIAARELEFRWTYTDGMNGQLPQVTALITRDSTISFTEADDGWLSFGEPQAMSIETCVESMVFRINDSLFCELPVLKPADEDSIRAYLCGSSGSLPHRIDDVRVFLRRW